MNVKEAIVIAGGFGTRLQSVVKDVPKPMAPVRGRPFLEILIEHLDKNGIKKAVLALGYRHELIQGYFTEHPQNISIDYSIETEPLGTGGCVKKALGSINGEQVLVVNGDTFFDVDIQGLYAQHVSRNADITLAVKHLSDCGRYGTVEMDMSRRVTGFGEKNNASEGYINGGVYLVKKDILKNMPEKFSFEKDLMTVRFSELVVHGYPSDGYFIDIGIPEDYEKAQKELK